MRITISKLFYNNIIPLVPKKLLKLMVEEFFDGAESSRAELRNTAEMSPTTKGKCQTNISVSR